MKISEWLPATQSPTRPDGGSTESVIHRLTDPLARFFRNQISQSMLGWAAAGVGATLIFRWMGVRAISVYVIIGLGIWFAVLMAGIHATVAGVMLGLLTPSTPWLAKRSLLKVLSGAERRLRKDRALGPGLVESGKIGALGGSAISAAVGCTLLWWFLRKESTGRE